MNSCMAVSYTHLGSIILHTASPCFDAIAVAWSALAVIAGNGADVESIIRMLQPGERVLCGKERGEFIGIETDENGKEWAVICLLYTSRCV